MIWARQHYDRWISAENGVVPMLNSFPIQPAANPSFALWVRRPSRVRCSKALYTVARSQNSQPSRAVATIITAELIARMTTEPLWT